ncbi:MAG: DNA-directed RNA polymerase subunit D [Archaeoglobaceae archaeon]|nr:DNA-directed RNA polymerase subunit D [Archaeoglobaceae archaeon]MCX8151850.1 DNA-directed RNA polymerase subunit D [Archaeoglobaceae archaeon]MDW8014318.1 DNA-directed RNA polymerase subunit D [Archaeoglobaceae archaeon]
MIEVIEENERYIKFLLKNSFPAFANSWRRAMKSLVPTMVIDYVDFYVNNSFFYDEVIAHRLALIPIKTDLNRYNFQEKCSCKGVGCPSCQVIFRLNVEGPKVVYSGDLVSEDPEVHFVYKDVPVLELFKGQQLMIEAVARLGIGKEHAKFQPVSVCFYKIVPKITVLENCNLCGACVNECSKKILRIDKKLEVLNILDCSLCKECVKVCENKAIKVEETNDFLFTIESTGALPVRTIMKKALEVLIEKAKEMNKILEEVHQTS